MISIYSLWKSGGIDLPLKLGIIKTSVPKYCEIYEAYLKERQEGKNYMTAVEATADKMCTSSDTVKRAIAEVM